MPLRPEKDHKSTKEKINLVYVCTVGDVDLKNIMYMCIYIYILKYTIVFVHDWNVITPMFCKTQCRSSTQVLTPLTPCPSGFPSARSACPPIPKLLHLSGSASSYHP